MPTVDNHWTRHADLLVPAYARAAGPLRFELVTRTLAAAIGETAVDVVDIGGGYGEQAIRLARLGHRVTVVDCDPSMLRMAEGKARREHPSVQRRVDFVLGSGADTPKLLSSHRFDLTCCHSVLLYESDPLPLLTAIVESTRQDGIVSIISTNRDARAMRSGLQQRWREATETLLSGTQVDSRCLPTAEHGRTDVERMLGELGAVAVGWQGLGVFTDHLEQAIPASDWDDVVACEWLAGTTDPYRSVARAYHLLARVERRSERENVA